MGLVRLDGAKTVATEILTLFAIRFAHRSFFLSILFLVICLVSMIKILSSLILGSSKKVRVDDEQSDAWAGTSVQIVPSL